MTWKSRIPEGDTIKAARAFDSYCITLDKLAGIHPMDAESARETVCAETRCASTFVGLPSHAVGTKHARCPACVLKMRLHHKMAAILERDHGHDMEPAECFEILKKMTVRTV